MLPDGFCSFSAGLLGVGFSGFSGVSGLVEDPEFDEEDKLFLKLDKASSSFDRLSATSFFSWAFWVDSSNLCKYVFSISFSFLISSTVLICCSFSKFFLMSSNKPVRCLVTSSFALSRSKPISRPLCLTTRASISCSASFTKVSTLSLLEASSNIFLYFSTDSLDSFKSSPNQKAPPFSRFKRVSI